MSSFRKFNKTKTLPKGTRLATNGQVLTSTGIASFDELLGGGFPTGRVMLVKHDRYTSYGTLLLKYFIAQGVMFEQDICVVSMDASPDTIMQELMGVVPSKAPPAPPSEEKSTRAMGQMRDRMNIAWRYEHLPTINPTLGSQRTTTFCHTFDVTRKLDAEHLSKASIYLIGREQVKQNSMESVLELLHERISLAQYKDGKMLRIAIHMFASPFWRNREVRIAHVENIPILAHLANQNSRYQYCDYADYSCLSL
jgi:elongator complex protein 4